MTLLARLLALLALATWSACAATQTTADARVRSALNLLTAIIDPIYSLAVDGCIARQEVVAGEAMAGRTTTTAASDAIAVIRVRCDRVRAAFEQIRALHEQARIRVEAGELEHAEQLIEQIRLRWRELGAGGSS